MESQYEWHIALLNFSLIELFPGKPIDEMPLNKTAGPKWPLSTDLELLQGKENVDLRIMYAFFAMI
jgi:hypothetical protein